MEVIIARGLVRIRKLTSSRRHKALQTACDSVFENFKQRGIDINTINNPNPTINITKGEEYSADGYIEPFILACDTRHPKMMEIALDCMQKLIAYGYLTGKGAIPESLRSPSPTANASNKQGGNNTNNDRLIDKIIQTICECNDHPDEQVQLQVLKALVTAVTSSTCEVHDSSLLSAIRACYHIHLVSKNMMNQTVAKAMLQQMLNVVFQRMETYDKEKGDKEKVQGEATEKSLSNNENDVIMDDEKRLSDDFNETEKDLIKAMRAESVGSVDEIDGQKTITKEMETPVPFERSIYPEVATFLGLHLTYIAPAPVEGIKTDNTNTQPETISNQTIASAATSSFPSVIHKDAFLIFRSLCRLSMRTLSEEPSGAHVQADPIALQSKCLSLELLYSILLNCGPSFRKGAKFIYALKQYLCVSLLSNCTSSYTDIMELSLKIFWLLLQHFKVYLKKEIEIFISNIFLKILESPNSSLENKLLVLEVLYDICNDASILGEIFLNYDCDWDSTDLFKRMVDALTKAGKTIGPIPATNVQLRKSQRHIQKTGSSTQSSPTQSIGTPPAGSANQQENNIPPSTSTAFNAPTNNKLKTLPLQEYAFGVGALECVVVILKSLKQSSHLGENDNQPPTVRSQNSEEDDDDEDGASQRRNTTTESSASNETGSGVTTMSVVEAFDRKQRVKEELATGILKFNVKPTAGIQYLISHGHIKNNPSDAAQFLLNNSTRLDKTMIGDYLGREPAYQNGFCIKVLHEFVDKQDFTGMEFDMAIRSFLSTFRLPGEAQKIDRIMEKFAERYCLNNASKMVFDSADTAFILAFSVIMLQTDLHNPNIPKEKKMDKSEFIKNNKGINGGKDLPEEFLSGIYDRMAANPFTLKEDDEYKRQIENKKIEGTAGTGLFSSVNEIEKVKREAYVKERETMVRLSEAAIKRKSKLKTATADTKAAPPLTPASKPYYSLRRDVDHEHIKPMFEIVWAPLLACISVVLEVSDNAEVVMLCTESFQYAIFLSSRYGMDFQRDAFVTSLAKFTSLYTIKEMEMKNIECIKTIILVAINNGNYLGDSWREILQCISQLARLQMQAQGINPDLDFLSTGSARVDSIDEVSSSELERRPSERSLSVSTAKGSSKRPTTGRSLQSSSFFSSSPTKDELAKAVEVANAEQVLNQIDLLAIDRVFSSSIHLSDTSIQDFVQQLCVVSLSETSGILCSASSSQGGVGSFETAQPRIFSLQKVVEVADMNMNLRSRMVWSSVWRILTRHFTTIGCHENIGIAMYAIDSLRQLSMKFLEKEELKDFNFQRLFLKPFEIIMSNVQNTNIKEFILRSIENMTLARVHNIRSGWKSILSVLTVAASEDEEVTANAKTESTLVTLSFQIIRRIIENHFPCVIEVYLDLINCLLEFALQSNEKICLESISVLSICYQKLAEGEVIEKLAATELENHSKQLPSTDVVQAVVEQQPNTEDADHCANAEAVALGVYSEADQSIWLSLLKNFKVLVIRDEEGNIRPAVIRIRAIDVLFANLEKYALKYTSKLWEIFHTEILFPIFMDPKLQNKDKKVICEHGLPKFVQIYGKYFDRITVLMLDGYLNVFHDYICQENLEIALSTIRILNEWTFSYGEKFDKNIWNTICNALCLVFETLLPADLLDVELHSPTTTINDKSGAVIPLSISASLLMTRVSAILDMQKFVGRLVEAHGVYLLRASHWKRLAEILENSCRFSREVNDNAILRERLSKLGFTYNVSTNNAKDLPNLLPQETMGMMQLVRIAYLFIQSYDTMATRYKEDAELDEQKFNALTDYLESTLQKTVEKVILDYVGWLRDLSTRTTAASVESAEVERQLATTLLIRTPSNLSPSVFISLSDKKQRCSSYSNLICFIIRGMISLPLPIIRKYLTWFYPLAAELVKIDSLEIRSLLYEYYLDPIQKLLKITG